MKKVGLIGGGYWGKNLIRNFYELGSLAWVCEQNRKLIDSYKEQYPDIDFSDQLDDLIDSSDVQGVVISVPAHLHYEIAKKCLLAGKDVYVEKPLCLDLDEAKELIELAKQEQKVLMVGHILHYHPGVIELKKILKSKKFGDIKYIYSNRLSWGKFRSEEDVLWSFAPHDISMILGLVDSPVSKVQNQNADFVQSGNADVSISHLEFENGIKGHIFVSWAHPFKEQRLVIVCDEATLVFDDTQGWDSKLSIYHNGVEFPDKGDPVAIKGEIERISLDEGEPLKEECRHFLKCMETRENPITDGEEGLRVLQVLDQLSKKKELDDMQYWVHDTAIVDEGAKVGLGTKVWHFSHVLSDVDIGADCSIGQNVVVMNKVRLGNNVKVQNNVSLYEGVLVEDDVFLGPSMVFTNVMNPRSAISRKHEYKETIVKRGASIGANATIICGNSLGKYSFVGAGSVVTKNVPDYALVYGNPAVLKGWMCGCGLTLDSDLTLNQEELQCSECQLKYKRSEDQVKQID